MRSLPSRRSAVLGALTGAALGLSLLTAPIGAASAADSADSETDSDFRPQLVKVITPTPSHKELLQGLGLDLTEHAGHDYVEVVLHTAADRTALQTAGLRSEVVIRDLVARGIENQRANAKYAASVTQSPMPSGRTGYRTLEDYEADMAKLAQDRPDLVKQLTLPLKTLDGNTVRGVEIAQDVEQEADGRPTFLLMGLHHAREWPSGELAMEFATDLVKNHGKDARITGLLQKARVVVVPVVNPDGFDLSRTDGEFVDLRDLNDVDPLGGSTSILATPGQAYKRKNCRLVDGQDIPDGSCRATANSNGGFGIGVDLNRNYGGFWGGPGAAGPAPDAQEVSAGVLDPTYRGAAPFSEPETENIQRLVSERQVTMLISNHTFSNLVLRPNGVNPNTEGPDGKPVGDAPDEDALKQLGARMTAQNGYQNIHGWQLYDTTGTTEDWSYNATGGFGYTFEIGENEFHPPYPEVVDEYLGAGKYAGKGNREAYLIALEHAVDTRYSGVLTGSAPEGAVIRLTKDFDSPTWESSFKDRLDSSVKVGASKKLRWIVNPSTRPVVRSRAYREVDETPYHSETFEATAPAPTQHHDHEFTFSGTADVLRVRLDWPTPDDYDLEVYRKHADGSLTEVGSSGNFVGDKESVEITDAEGGTYVLRVINYASVSPDYTLTAGLHETVTRQTKGTTEAYELTCEKNGEVLQRSTVSIDRGQSKKLDLAQCRKRW
jgi:hypothetical protein